MPSAGSSLLSMAKNLPLCDEKTSDSRNELRSSSRCNCSLAVILLLLDPLNSAAPARGAFPTFPTAEFAYSLIYRHILRRQNGRSHLRRCPLRKLLEPVQHALQIASMSGSAIRITRLRDRTLRPLSHMEAVQMSEKSEAPSGIDRKASAADHTQMRALTQSLSDRNGCLAIQPRRIWPTNQAAERKRQPPNYGGKLATTVVTRGVLAREGGPALTMASVWREFCLGRNSERAALRPSCNPALRSVETAARAAAPIFVAGASGIRKGSPKGTASRPHGGQTLCTTSLVKYLPL
jgi:hypothetical protein